jgi:hypothetical protein
MIRFLMLLSVALAGLVNAGPVGAYLGFEVGRKATHAGAGRDSICIIYPEPFDTVVTSQWTDTTTVIAETLHAGSPAWLLRRTRVIGGAQSQVDTAYESGDTLMRGRFTFGEIDLWTNAYMVPFTVGSWWRTGVEGTWYVDLNGDSIPDTLSIWADTTRVIGITDVVVPWDTVRGCYELLTTFRQAASLRESIFPIRESSRVRIHTWYKDSLCLVKDSSSIEGTGWVWLLFWIRAAEFTSMMTRELTDVRVGVQEPPRAHSLPAIRVEPNPSRSRVRISLSRNVIPGEAAIHIYNSSGRRVRTLRGLPATWDGTDDASHRVPAGVYLLRAGTTTRSITRLE